MSKEPTTPRPPDPRPRPPDPTPRPPDPRPRPPDPRPKPPPPPRPPTGQILTEGQDPREIREKRKGV